VAASDLTGLESALVRLVEDLGRLRARFALVGGLAVGVRAEPRLTRDADVALSVKDDGEAEAIVYRLVSVGYQPVTVLEQDATSRLATVRLVHPDRPAIMLDLLFASCGIEPEIVELADEVEVLPGFVVPVARTGHLIAMKLLARDDRQRPADADDLRALAEAANPSDWDLARQAVDSIVERGYSRSRDLAGSLAEFAPLTLDNS
jgi:hypothetical protein